MSNRLQSKRAKAFILTLLTIPIFILTAHAETIVGGNITSDTIWTPDGSPYLVTSDISIVGPPGEADNFPTLTVTTLKNSGEHGDVIVKISAGKTINVGLSATYNWDRRYGALDVQGIAEHRIIFTSESEDSFWQGIRFSDATKSSHTHLSFCNIERGGYYSSGYGGGNIRLEKNNALFGATNPIVQCRFRESYADGIYVYRAGLVLSNSTIESNNRHGIYFRENSFATLGGCEIAANEGHGVYCDSTSVSLVLNSNRFAGNLLGPACMPPAKFNGQNKYTDNGEQAVTILGMQIKESGNYVFPNEGIPYHITGTTDYDGLYFLADQDGELINVTVEPGVVIEFDPGTSFRVEDAGTGQATFTAEGTQAEPITFTSRAPGQYWYGISFAGHALFSINYCTIEYGGDGESGANLSFFGTLAGKGNIENTTIRYSKADGIRLHSAQVGNFYLHNNNIYGNALYDIDDDWQSNRHTIHAQLNWWGSPNGPSENLCSAAVVRADNIEVDGWLSETFSYPFRFTSAGARPLSFNPLQEHTTFSFILSHDAQWSISVMNTHLETIWSTSGIAGGGDSIQVDWNGTGEYGSASGMYYYMIDAEGQEGRATPAMGILTIGDGAIAKIIEPLSGTTIASGDEVSITGIAIVGEGHYEVAVRAGDSQQNWESIGTGYEDRENEVLAIWDTSGVSRGEYAIRLAVKRGETTYSDLITVYLWKEEEVPSGEKTVLFHYNSLHQLTDASYTNGSSVSYHYDLSGNRTKKITVSGEQAGKSARTLAGVNKTKMRLRKLLGTKSFHKKFNVECR